MATAIGGGCCFSPSPSLLNRYTSSPPSSLRLLAPAPRNLTLRASTCRIRTGIVAANLIGSSLGENLGSDGTQPSSKEVSFDLKLPRRNLMVQFTCDACGERTDRTINRAAYERGTVFVQCAGCEVYHKLVDNLGLIVEYDLLEGEDAVPSSDDAI